MKLPWTAVLDTGYKIIDELFETDTEKAEAALKLESLRRSDKLETLRTSLSAINSEAQSNDPWTSRARPTFLYVMYTYMLLSPLFGFLFFFDPVLAAAVIEGFQMFLAAIPSEMWALFGAGYLGYAHYRTSEKKGLK